MLHESGLTYLPLDVFMAWSVKILHCFALVFLQVLNNDITLAHVIVNQIKINSYFAILC